MIKQVVFGVCLMSAGVSAQAECSFWDIGDRLSSSVTPATLEAFALMDQALENPDLMHSPDFRARLADRMEAAGMDGKRYLAPPTESGPFPSKDLMASWLEDARSVVLCD